MKSLVLCAFVVATWVAPSMAAEPSAACMAKQKRIEAQIADATAQGRTQELAGLRKSLKSNTAHCTDKSLADERERKITGARKKVASREKDLQAAEKKGDAKKIETRKAKLEEARAELVEAEKPVLP